MTFDLIAHLYRQRAFSRATFGPGARTEGVTDHIRKELNEVSEAVEMAAEDNANDPEFPCTTPGLDEWVDVILLALDGAWRTGATPEEIANGIRLKQDVNESRDWPDWRTQDPNRAIEHKREGDDHD